MQIRDAVPADSEAIRAVHAASIRELGQQSYSQTQVEAWAQGCATADYTATIESAEVEFLVAEQDGAIVGFASLKLAPPAEYEATVQAEVTGVYVHPEIARHGVGRRLYSELEQRARTAGVETLGLLASLNSVPFYEERGFERVTEHIHEFSSDEATGVTGTVVEMKKRIE